jgi:hypothetical protein
MERDASERPALRLHSARRPRQSFRGSLSQYIPCRRAVREQDAGRLDLVYVCVRACDVTCGDRAP